MGSNPAVDLYDTELTFRGVPTWKLHLIRLMFRSILPRLVAHGETLGLLTLRIPILGKLLVRYIGPFPYFCGGTSIEDCEGTVKRLHQRGIRSILDYSAEGLKNEAGFDVTRDEVLHALRHASSSSDEPFGVFKITGVGDKDLLEKVSSGAALTANERAAFDRTVARVRQICATAAEDRLRVLIDAEESWIQKAIDDIAEEMMAEFNREQAIIYTTVQMYRVDRLDYLQRLYERGVSGGFIPGVKLVRGAYMEAERARAAATGQPDPIHATKEATDAAFDAAVAFCIEHIDRIALVAGTHNEASVAKLLDQMSRRGLTPGDPRVECSQLLGMSDNLSRALAEHGYNTSKYVPYGPLETAIPYLVRRAQENSSVAGQTDRELRLVTTELARRRGAK
ncbi:MAG: proline dehydrogenase family protein [Acidobacteria bacterium]|nr:proline dehydrogenase family protein [Acidobacteriota bacterium]MBV9478990.1 proline dehydrogenase family protein [Acidobacteriota bacterium]